MTLLLYIKNVKRFFIWILNLKIPMIDWIYVNHEYSVIVKQNAHRLEHVRTFLSISNFLHIILKN